MNPDPHKARISKKRRTVRPGSLTTLRSKLWKAILKAEDLLEEEDSELCLRAIHALCQAAAAYGKLFEIGELEARLRALEERVDNVKMEKLARSA